MTCIRSAASTALSVTGLLLFPVGLGLLLSGGSSCGDTGSGSALAAVRDALTADCGFSALNGLAAVAVAAACLWLGRGPRQT